MRLYFLCLAIAACLTGCGNNKKPNTGADNEEATELRKPTDEAEKADEAVDESKPTGNDVSVNPFEMVTGTKDLEKKMEAMKKLKPLTTDEIKALLPDAIGGMARSKFEVNSTMGISSGAAYYKSGDQNKLKLRVFDCGGESGATVYGMNYLTLLSFQQESDKEYTKSVDFKGAKAVEKYDKKKNEPELTYMANERLLVSLKGRDMQPEELRAVAEGLSFPAN